MIQETLKQLGLKDKEILVYLEVMKLGRSTPARIARLTSLNRATVYSVLAILVEKGIVAEDVGGAIRFFYALPPSGLNTLIEREQALLAEKEKLVAEAIQQLSDMPLNTEYSLPHIRFFDENTLKHQLHESVERWEASMQKTDPTLTWWGFQDHTFAEHFKEWIMWYWSRVPEGVHVKLLTNASKVEKDIGENGFERRQIKTLTEETQFTATTWVIGEYLVMLYTHARPFYAIEIHNPVLAHNHRELFKTFWGKV
jgi:sugar-specific transcriptional regulator TrmB